MRILPGLAAGALVLATSLLAQQPQAQPAPAQQQPAQSPQHYEPPMVIHRIDLNPTGSVFTMDEPKLEGDYYVCHTLPDRTIQRIRKDRVKKITQRSRDFDKEVVWQVEMEPTGSVLAVEEPVKKGSAYVFTTYKGGTLTTVKQADVKKITRLAGMDAFKAEELELGLTVMTTNPTFQGDGTQNAAPARAGGAPAATPAKGNWTYQGQPGASDAYAPGSGTVSRPGDVPKAPPPTAPPK
ncbi:hypothetical protein FBQ97_01475 [Acidobacteria bacterium ACD]|nr:MAG: hypothetical protein EDX89_11320 [Acidobacteriota bacterium]MDL1948472.1 hypothetical protein [Acidobacteria bacterium ACD]